MIIVRSYTVQAQIVKATVEFDHTNGLTYTREYGWNVDQVSGVTEAQAIQAINQKVDASRAEITAQYNSIDQLFANIMNRDIELGPV